MQWILEVQQNLMFEKKFEMFDKNLNNTKIFLSFFGHCKT